MVIRLLCCVLATTIFGCSGEQDAPSPTPVQEPEAAAEVKGEQLKPEPKGADKPEKADVRKPQTPLPSRVEGFDSPSSVEYDPLLDRYLVANSGVHPWNKDGK